MKVAIIDDEKDAQDILIQYIQRFSQEKNCVIDVTCFISGLELLEEYKAIFDILIFDVNMPGISGLETAKKIREKDRNVIILFITSMTEYAINGYEVDAIDYVIKPVTYFDFALKMTKAVRLASKKEDNAISIETVDGIKKVFLSDIYYVEIFAHYLIYHTSFGTYKVRGNLSDAEKTLIPYNFCRTHKSFVVNLKFVQAIKAQDVVVNKRTLPLGRAYKSTFMQEFMRFVQG